MTNFYDYLKDNNLQDYLTRVDFKIPSFAHLQDVLDVIVNGIKQGKYFYLYGDYDVDGLMCIRCLSSIFERLDYENFSVFEYRKRTHALDKIAPHKCLQYSADIFVVADTGSSKADKELLDKLVADGVEVIVLDHHESDFTYEDYDASGIHIINTIIENSMGGDFDLSAGALCFCVASAVLDHFNIDYRQISCYALTSLYSDCMNMGNKLNRSIYALAKSQDVPIDLLYFMNKYCSFNSRYIEYWFAPRVNALFRSENLNLINKLFITKIDNPTVLSTYITKVEDVYTRIRELISSICDVLVCTEMDNFVVADLGSVNSNFSVLKNKLWNYTGLVASKLASRYQKAAIVYCTNGESYNGSFRDLYGREFLHVFKSFCNAGGHGAAFGYVLTFQELPNFLKWIKTLDSVGSTIQTGNQPIIIDYPYNDPDIVMLKDVANYNEFAGKGVPQVLIRKQVIGNMKSEQTKFGYASSWGIVKMKGDQKLQFGSTLLLKPYWANELKLERV